MDTGKLNKALEKLFDVSDEYTLPELKGSGKLVPYLGWFWRDIDFEWGVEFAIVPFIGEDNDKPHVWIDSAGKWDYPSFAFVVRDGAEAINKIEHIRMLLVKIVKARKPHTRLRAARKLYDHIQTLIPEHWANMYPTNKSVRRHVKEVEYEKYGEL